MWAAAYMISHKSYRSMKVPGYPCWQRWQALANITIVVLVSWYLNRKQQLKVSLDLANITTGFTGRGIIWDEWYIFDRCPNNCHSQTHYWWFMVVIRGIPLLYTGCVHSALESHCPWKNEWLEEEPCPEAWKTYGMWRTSLLFFFSYFWINILDVSC